MRSKPIVFSTRANCGLIVAGPQVVVLARTRGQQLPQAERRHGLNLRAGEVAALEDPERGDAAAAAIASMTAAAPARNGCAGTSPTWWNGERSSGHAAHRAARRTAARRTRADEPVGDAHARARHERVGEVPSPRKSKAVGRQLAPASSMPRQRDAGALGGGAGPREHAGGERERRRGAGREQRAGRRASALRPTGQREQRLELLVGLLASRGGDLRAGEQADREDEEEEVEAEVARPA